MKSYGLNIIRVSDEAAEKLLYRYLAIVEPEPPEPEDPKEWAPMVFRAASLVAMSYELSFFGDFEWNVIEDSLIKTGAYTGAIKDDEKKLIRFPRG